MKINLKSKHVKLGALLSIVGVLFLFAGIESSANSKAAQIEYNEAVESYRVAKKELCRSELAFTKAKLKDHHNEVEGASLSPDELRRLTEKSLSKSCSPTEGL